MKILAIRGRNLASLENFEVSFESGPLEHTGIFAITGPTGAGKTTLLDAMCVALFDRTPRLSNRAGVPVGLADEDDAHRILANDVRGLLRRGCAEGFAEVDFLGRDDRGYRARWQVHRARRSAKGKLQQAQLSLSCLDSARVLHSGKKTETLQAIEDALGLSFEQFRRSALLAQNDFAAFLRADKDERSELLERMTGTEVYTRVSVAAFRRAADEAKEVELLQSSADASQPLDDAERDTLQLELTALREREEQHRQALHRAQAATRWHLAHAQALAGFEQATRAEAHAQEALQALAPAESEMQLARAARRHMGVIDATQLRRREAEQAVLAQSQAQEAVHSAQGVLAHTQARVGELAAAIEAARAKLRDDLQAQRTELGESDRRLQAWLLDHEELRRAGREHAEFADMSAQALDALAPQLDALLSEWHGKLAAIGRDSQLCKADLEKARERHSQARVAAQELGLGELRKRVSALVEELGDVRQLEEMVASARKSHVQLREFQAEAGALQQQIDAGLASVEECTQAVRSKRDVVREAEASFDRIRIAIDFSEQRAQLKEGAHCPLCGSEQHPFANDAQVVHTIVAEQQERVQTLRTELDTLNRAQAERDSAQQAATQALTKAKRNLASNSAELDRLRDAFQAHRASQPWRELDMCSDATLASMAEARAIGEQSLQDSRQALVRAEEADAEVHTLAEKVEAAQRKWEAMREQAVLAEQELSLASERRGSCLAQRYRVRDAELHRCRAALELVHSRLADAAHWRFPELQTQHEQAIAVEHKASQELAAAQARLLSTQARIVETEQAIVACDERLEEVLDQLDCSWRELGRRLSIPEEELHTTELALQAARHALAQAQGSTRECRLRVSELQGQDAPTLREEEAARGAALEQTRLGELAEAGMELGARLKADALARERRDQLDKRMHAAVARAHTFRALSDLIGSADGKKFRVFAQSLTLDSLLAGANLHLADLAPRYLLQRVPGHDLDLQIVDRDLGDDVRSVHSLSGGESFLISLALALGLSSLASREVRVESLLVDEGFGSLDEDTLEIALGVLDSLQATGRKVGLISHVPGFAERIGAQVQVVPQGGGRSSVRVCGGDASMYL